MDIGCLVSHVMLGFDEECKAHLKMLKLEEDKNEKDLALYQYRRMVRRKKRQYYQMQEK